MPTKAGFSDAIVITKKALEEWRDHYMRLMKKYHDLGNDKMGCAYLGKADVLNDILKHFNNEEYETV